jgi:hypothetical protein
LKFEVHLPDPREVQLVIGKRQSQPKHHIKIAQNTIKRAHPLVMHHSHYYHLVPRQSIPEIEAEATQTPNRRLYFLPVPGPTGGSEHRRLPLEASRVNPPSAFDLFFFKALVVFTNGVVCENNNPVSFLEGR